MLYKKSFSDKLFASPTSEYRATPFWAWNGKLDIKELNRQIGIFSDMGYGGFHIHTRTGLETKYLSDEYMTLCKDVCVAAESKNMLCYLYDEDRWPSGAAGGLVTKEEQYRGRCLLFSPYKTKENIKIDTNRMEGGRTNNGKVLAVYDIVLDEEGFLESYRRIDEEDVAKGRKWYAMLEIHTPSKWYNDQTYVDTLNSKAIERFIEVTHEKYKEVLGDKFGKTVPSVFTDEPQFSKKRLLNDSLSDNDIIIPWTDDVPQKYKAVYNADIWDTLPEIFWEKKDKSSLIHRYRYHDFIAELFASSFADTIGEWCDKNGIALTGHMMEEPTLQSQCSCLGEAMRSYRSFTIPGIDMLCFRYEYTTAKQAQSAAHQYGREGVMSEIYGVTNWDCDFRTYKIHGDWQAALGVTLRVPHLAWYGMGGEAKRDYPASMSFHSPWYEKYPLIENHFARLNTALTDGKPVVKIGVIHPIESFWLCYGPDDKTLRMRHELDKRFRDVTDYLLESNLDFDYICESLLPELTDNVQNPLAVGKAKYDAIVIPGLLSLRKSTVDILKSFAEKGGKVIIMGKQPYYCDGQVSDYGRDLFNNSEHIDFSRFELIEALEPYRTVLIQTAEKKPVYDYLYNMREDESGKWLFVCHKAEPYNIDVDYGTNIEISVKGEYHAVKYDTASGQIKPIKYRHEKGKTIVCCQFFGYDSLLLRFDKTTAFDTEIEEPITFKKEGKSVQSTVDYVLSEDNVLMLDMAEYKFGNDTSYHEREEILRLDNIVRNRLGLSKRDQAIVQPYLMNDRSVKGALTLKYTFFSEIEYSGAKLSLESLDFAKSIVFNGKEVLRKPCGFFVDKAIETIVLPNIKVGKNTLVVSFNYGDKTNIEAMYILGKFGVKLNGNIATIYALPEKIGFGDIARQGLPFYGGNISYKFSAESHNGKMCIEASMYRGALIEVVVDGKKQGHIIYPPYRLEIKTMQDGMHDVELVLYGNRYNTFGPLHLMNRRFRWHGPNAWRKDNQHWSYEYHLHELGILSAPKIL